MNKKCEKMIKNKEEKKGRRKGDHSEKGKKGENKRGKSYINIGDNIKYMLYKSSS